MPFFIAIDGIDGVGKSTQVKLAGEYLQTLGHPCELTLEPGGTAAGREIRRILLNSEHSLEPACELLLFAADRAAHLKKIEALLDSGVSVITDRFLASSFAYQIFGRKAPAYLLEAVTAETVKRFPDLTIILDLAPEEAIQRAEKRLKESGGLTSEGRFEGYGLDFFRSVQEGFRWYAAEKRFGKTVIVDAGGTPSAVGERVKTAIETLAA